VRPAYHAHLTSKPQNANGFRDHYEILQLSPNADGETIHRVYRTLIKRYHPDNAQSGDQDKFAEVLEAYRVLSDPERRLAYDVKYDEGRAHMLSVYRDVSAGNTFESDLRVFDGILSLLYISRRRDPQRGGMGVIQLERLLGSPAEHLEFHVWYLLEKQLIERQSTGQLAITAAGVDHMVQRDSVSVRSERSLPEKASEPADESKKLR
jgi:curved DNA-binding protein